MLVMGYLLIALVDGKNIKKLYSALGRNNIQGRKKWNHVEGKYMASLTFHGHFLSEFLSFFCKRCLAVDDRRPIPRYHTFFISNNREHAVQIIFLQRYVFAIDSTDWLLKHLRLA